MLEWRKIPRRWTHFSLSNREGYTLVDTLGIYARGEHARIATAEIAQSDLILFVMDNADTFENAVVYQAIIDILRTGKALAGVLNQKNAPQDEKEIPGSDQKSMIRILQMMTNNLEIQGVKSGVQDIRSQRNFIVFFR